MGPPGDLRPVISFRGFVDVLAHKLIPRASLYGAGHELMEDDIVAQRRVWYWRRKFRLLFWLVLVVGGSLALLYGLGGTPSDIVNAIPQMAIYFLSFGLQLPLFFLMNIIILFGPMLFFGLRQMKGYEPGDADWGVKLEDVRGQAEPKAEVTKVIELWSAGEEFRKAGGKPERGLLFIGAPGTGKTMLSKGIATSFNSPIVTMPGSGFAQTFIGMDVVIVMALIRKARKLARKWGNTCMIFIDEIDAVGMRRQALQGGNYGFRPTTTGFEEPPMYGPWGSLTPTGDLILENRQWRERMFMSRAEPSAVAAAGPLGAVRDRIQGVMFPGMGGMGGGLALNQLLVQMDGVDEPPMMRKFFTNRINTFLDATYVIPRGSASCACASAPQAAARAGLLHRRHQRAPRRARPGAHPPRAHGPPHLVPHADEGRPQGHLRPLPGPRQPRRGPRHDERRDELARMTNGYSPAMIEQVCSMALTYAHSEAREDFDRKDIVEAMTTIESGTAVGVNYIDEESRAVAIHEAGHAVASHVYMNDVLSTRLSIRMRGGSLGHHQAIQKEERFSSWRHEDVGNLVWTLGAMAAEHVFYGENSNGVGGDIQSATWIASRMVGMSGMGPEPLDLRGRVAKERLPEVEKELMERFERIGLRIMNRARMGSAMDSDPIGSVLGDPAKRSAAAQILGQAYLTAVCCIRANREAVAAVADALVQHKELYGDEVVELLEAAAPRAPVIDVLDESIWPKV